MTWRRGALVGLVAACLAACQAVESTSAPRPSNVTSATPVAPPDAVDPEALVIVERGFTAFAEDGADFASFGIVLTNPNPDWAVVRSEVFIDFFDADDAFIAGEEVFLTLLPGQTSAIAGEAFGAGRATRMEVGLPDDTTAFEPATDSGRAFDVTDVSTTRSDDLNVTSGTLTSRFGTVQRLVQLAAIYRDAGGGIVGGAVGGVDAIEPGQELEFEIVDAAPHGDLAAAEVFWQLSGIGR